MKMTGREMTLRGTISQQLNRAFAPHNIFEYANVLDLSKAWKVKGYAVWAQGWRDGFATNNALDSASIESFLATDIGIFDSASVLMNNSPEDNRQIAWGNVRLSMGAGDKANNTQSQSVAQEHYWIDPQHIIQDELNLYLRIGASDAYEGQIKNFNYIVYLEEVEITPVESIIFNIKGKSQDLSS